ncbi:MAG: four helix bundle protein [Alphaproteobacteria bacterium]
MALTEQLLIYNDCYKLLLEIYRITNKFSREHKYGLGEDIKQQTFSLFLYIYKANLTEDKEKYLLEFLEAFAILKLKIRLCKDMNLISTKTMVVLVEIMNKIGKQATAWKNKRK